MGQPAQESDFNAQIRMAKEILDHPERDRDLVQHVRACGTLASAEWGRQMVLLRQVAGIQLDFNPNAADIAEMAASQPLLTSELLQKSDELVSNRRQRYDELLRLIEHSPWRSLSRHDKEIAARWYLLQEQDADYAGYLTMRLFTGVDPEVRSAYFNQHCLSKE